MLHRFSHGKVIYCPPECWQSYVETSSTIFLELDNLSSRDATRPIKRAAPMLVPSHAEDEGVSRDCGFNGVSGLIR